MTPQPVPAAGAAALVAARETVRQEAAAVAALEERLDDRFEAVVELILAAPGRVVITGLGKSGHIGRKIAASMASTGTPAFFVHATEALHGDSGMVAAGDVLIALSASGETTEVCQFAKLMTGRDLPVVAVTGKKNSTLNQIAGYALDAAVDREADPLNLAPTTSTTVTLVLGDALAIALSVRRDFTEDDFAGFHPAGALGRRLLGERWFQ